MDELYRNNYRERGGGGEIIKFVSIIIKFIIIFSKDYLIWEKGGHD